MKIIKLCIDRESLSVKPNKAHTGAIKKRLHEYPREVEMPILADMVGNKGHSFYCGTPTGMTNNDWNGQQLVVLDYDDEGINYNDVYRMFEGVGLTPTFSYKTLSYTEEYHKFRLVWALNEPITDFRVAVCITNALIKISENKGYKVDKASRKIAQMWLGGKGILHTNFNLTLALDTLFNTLISECLADENGNANRKLLALCKDLGVNALNNKPCITPIECFNGELSSAIVSNGLAFEFGAFTEKKDGTYKASVDKRKESLNRPIRLDLENNLENCQLLHEMTTGEHIKKYPHDTHEQFFGLATNLHNVEGGATLLRDIVNKNPYNNKRSKLTTLDCARDMNYLPMSCNKFCPYQLNCGAYNVASAIQGTKRLGVVKIADTPTVTLETAREQLKDIMDGIYAPFKTTFYPNDMDLFARLSAEARDMLEREHWEQSLHTVVIGTGVGKTHALKNRNLYGTANCFKTHDLCKEFIKDNPNKNILYVKALNTDNMPQDMKDELNLRYMCKADVKGFLQRQIEPYGADTNKPEWYYDIQEYLECIEQIKTADTVVMTHKRMSYMYNLGNKTLNTITFDEDALTELLQLSSVDYYRTADLLRNAYDVAIANKKYEDIAEPLSKWIEIIKQLNEGVYIDTSSNVLDYKTVSKIRKCMINELGHDMKQVYAIMPLFSYVAITRPVGADTIQGLTERISSLPKLKTVILSATVDEQLMRMLFNRFAPNRRYYHHEVAEVEHKGQLILHAGRTYSRTSVADDTQYISELANKHKVKSVITYKANITQFKNREKNTDIKFMNYGDCLGYNAMGGQDIVIVGTPNIPSYVYELYGFTLTGQVPQSTNWSIKKITRNGFEFPLNTYTSDLDKVFTDIQLYFVTSEIKQAVGRARLVNQDCTVHLYSNIPLPQCTVDNNK